MGDIKSRDVASPDKDKSATIKSTTSLAGKSRSTAKKGLTFRNRVDHLRLSCGRSV